MPKIILCCESSVKEGWLVKDENENRFHAIHKEDISEGYEPPKRGEFLNGYAVAEAYADSVYGLCLSYRSDDPREDPRFVVSLWRPKDDSTAEAEKPDLVLFASDDIAPFNLIGDNVLKDLDLKSRLDLGRKISEEGFSDVLSFSSDPREAAFARIDGLSLLKEPSVLSVDGKNVSDNVIVSKDSKIEAGWRPISHGPFGPIFVLFMTAEELAPILNGDVRAFLAKHPDKSFFSSPAHAFESTYFDPKPERLHRGDVAEFEKRGDKNE